MERRVLMAAAASVVILVLWGWWFPNSKPERRPPVTLPAVAASEAARQAAPPVEGVPQVAAAPPASSPAAAGEGWERHVAESPETIEVRTEFYQVALSNVGGSVSSWRLLQFRAPDGDPLAVFPRFIEPESSRLLDVDLDDPDQGRRLNSALWLAERSIAPAEEGGGQRVSFHWADGAGLEARKTLTFRDADYLVDVQLEVRDRGRVIPARVLLGPGFAAQEPRQSLGFNYASQVLYQRSGVVTRLSSKDAAEDPRLGSGPFGWAGLEDIYFAALMVPRAATAEVGWRAQSLTPVPTSDTKSEAAPQPLVAVSVPPDGVWLFVGPKKLTLLHDLGHGLEGAIYFSRIDFLAWITRGLFVGLLWIHDHVIGNWGLAIICATFLLRLLLFPVNQYSMVKMKKAQLQMQRIAPKMKRIRERYAKKKDTESRGKMNQEMMALYKDEGVNPMGGVAGCLPLLAQFPILIGFYNMLTVAVELRGAPFFGWIQDLSSADPWKVTPILMGITMFIQQKMAMNKIKDPQQLQQQRMMLVMPFVFTFVCLNMPSGMVLYWFVNNLLGIGQQYLVNRHTERLEEAHQEA